MIEMIFASFLVGFLVAIPPGAVTVVAAQKSILYGFRDSLLFTFGSCLSDIFYIFVVFFGVSPIFENNVLLKIVFWYLSSILLFYFGYDAIRNIRKKDLLSLPKTDPKTISNNILSGVLVTLSNPMTIAGWVVIAGGFFTHWSGGWPSIHQYGILSIIIMMAGVLAWFIPLLFAISKAKILLNDKIIKGFLAMSILFFLGIGIFSSFSATKLLIDEFL